MSTAASTYLEPTGLALEVFDPVALLVRAGVVDASGVVMPAFQGALELARTAMAESTRRGYRLAWEAYRRYALGYGVEPLGSPPALVAAYLTSRMGQIDSCGRLVRDESGNPLPGNLRPSSAQTHLAAIDKAHDLAGLDKPGSSAIVEMAMRGGRRTWGMATNPRLALDGELLTLVLGSVGHAEFLRRRHLAILAVLSGLESVPTPGQLARLSFDDGSITITSGAVGLVLGPTSRHGRRREISLDAKPGSPLCPVKLLTGLREACRGTGPGFRADPAGGPPLSRAGMVKAVGQAETAAGIAGPLAGSATRKERERLVGRLPVSLTTAPLAEVRDRSLLTLGWWACRRRSELSALDWGDVERYPDDVCVNVRRSKTDQEAHGFPVWVPTSDDPAYPCAVAALEEWAGRLAAILSTDPSKISSGLPVFCPVDRHDRPVRTRNGDLARLGGQAICDIVKRRAAAAGLDPARYGAHSLRAGFITECLTDDKLSLAEVQEVSGHKNLSILLTYHRRVNARSKNPSRKVFRRG